MCDIDVYMGVLVLEAPELELQDVVVAQSRTRFLGKLTHSSSELMSHLSSPKSSFNS